MDTQVPSHTGVYKVIRENYGETVMKCARHYVNTARKAARQREHIAFNMRCRHYHIVPNSLQIRPLVNTTEGYALLRELVFSFSMLELMTIITDFAD
jgi:hypothetical protein